MRTARVVRSFREWDQFGAGTGLERHTCKRTMAAAAGTVARFDGCEDGSWQYGGARHGSTGGINVIVLRVCLTLVRAHGRQHEHRRP